MIVRVRSNLGAWKVTVGEDGMMTVKELKEQILKECNFTPDVCPQDITLSSKMVEDEHAYHDPSMSLRQIGIRHGSLIFITTRLKHITVDKSYVDKDGVMVEAGKKVTVEHDNSKPVKKVNSDDQEDPLRSEEFQTHNSPNCGAETTQLGMSMADEEAIAKLMKEDLNDMDESNSDNIRPPDATKSMRLFDPPSGMDNDIEEDDYQNCHLSYPADVRPMISSTLKNKAMKRHGRIPLSDREEGRRQFSRGREQGDDCDQYTNEEVLASARAAGISEEEIQHMLDEEYANKLQCTIISDDLENDTIIPLNRDSALYDGFGLREKEIATNNKNIENLTSEDEEDVKGLESSNPMDQQSKLDQAVEKVKNSKSQYSTRATYSTEDHLLNSDHDSKLPLREDRTLLNDSLDEEVLSYALKMSLEDSGASKSAAKNYDSKCLKQPNYESEEERRRGVSRRAENLLQESIHNESKFQDVAGTKRCRGENSDDIDVVETFRVDEKSNEDHFQYSSDAMEHAVRRDIDTTGMDDDEQLALAIQRSLM